MPISGNSNLADQKLGTWHLHITQINQIYVSYHTKKTYNIIYMTKYEVKYAKT